MQELDEIKVYTLMPGQDASKIKDDFCYLIASNGAFLKRRGSIMTSITAVEKIPHLGEIKEETILTLSTKDLIPMFIVAKALSFFQAVYDLHKSEAALLLTFENGVWGLQCPEQEVSGGAVEYTNQLNGKTVVGSIHSHADFGAFHSGIDDADEEEFDGIHITLGNVNSTPTISCSLVSNGKRTMCKQKEFITGRSVQIPVYFPPDWMKKVSARTWQTNLNNFTGLIKEGGKGWKKKRKKLIKAGWRADESGYWSKESF